jgi:hypothetical protein
MGNSLRQLIGSRKQLWNRVINPLAQPCAAYFVALTEISLCSILSTFSLRDIL